MAENTKIEWTRASWNPWWGCSAIAHECGCNFSGEGAPCYAERDAGRDMHPRYIGIAPHGVWSGEIRTASEAVWNQPYVLNRAAQRAGEHWLVFTCSMSDFWHEDVPLEALDRALGIISDTKNLTYQILTKRPGNIARKLDALGRQIPNNVWLGLTLGHVHSMPMLKPFLRIAAPKKFLSCEPLLTALPDLNLDCIDWVIGGGQSGPRALVTNSEWMCSLRDLCVAGGIPFFLKQWGSWDSNPTPRHLELDLKAKGGATLDGRLWREFPERS